jgi:hypothetical protein
MLGFDSNDPMVFKNRADQEITCTIYNFKDLGGGIKMCLL